MGSIIPSSDALIHKPSSSLEGAGAPWLAQEPPALTGQEDRDPRCPEKAACDTDTGRRICPCVVYLPVWLMFSITGDLQDSLCSVCSSVPSTAAERSPSTTGRQTPRAGRAPAAGWSSGTGTRGKPAPLETDGNGPFT